MKQTFVINTHTHTHTPAIHTHAAEYLSATPVYIYVHIYILLSWCIYNCFATLAWIPAACYDVDGQMITFNGITTIGCIYVSTYN